MIDTISARDIASRLGLTKHVGSWRGRCPACDYTGETFIVRELRGGASLYCANGCGRDALGDIVNRVMGGAWTPPERAEAADEVERRTARQERALALWNGAEAASGTPADTYLTGRGLSDLARSPALRWRLDTPHPEGGRLPAILALVVDAAGAPIAVHRTYLRRDGTGKADITPAKASLGPVWGGAVRLDPIGPELVIGEGIESSASAGRMPGLPAWSALSAGNLARGLVLPPEVRAVVIAADNDPPTDRGIRPGPDAAAAASTRWQAQGRTVRIATPDVLGSDFNDVLRAREVAHA
jgi:putative DNA primase/helicase